MATLKSALTLLCLVSVIGGLRPIMASAAMTTTMAGGTGGTRFDLACPEGEVLAGVSGKAGLWLDRLIPLCVQLLPSDRRRWNGQPHPMAGTGGNPPPPAQTFTALCRQDRAIGGFSGKQGQYIDFLTIECRDLDTEGKLTGPSIPQPVAGGMGGSAFGPFRCSNNQAATGLVGQSGLYVDRLGLKCTPDSVWRPVFHFSPQTGWMNDPAGLVFQNGTYHLHYQAIPGATSFSADHMTWGHAVSTNLVDWFHRPAVFSVFQENVLPGRSDILAPFTGSAVALTGAQAQSPPCSCGGVVPSCIAAVFTRHATDKSFHLLRQNQVVSTSCNAGQTYSGPPGTLVLENPRYPDPRGLNFRDPKVFRFEGAVTNTRCGGNTYWVMVLAMGDRIGLFCSQTLIQWNLFSKLVVYGQTGLEGPFVETPDLMPLQVEGSTERRWALLFAEGFIPPGVCRDFLPPATLASIGLSTCENNVLANYSKSFYIVGAFDGTTFTPNVPVSGPLRTIARNLDAGPDFYAPQTWMVPSGLSSTISMPAQQAPLPNSSSFATSPSIGIQSRSVESDTAVSGMPEGESPQDDITARGLSYAGQAQYILGGWESNWRYAHTLPTTRWRGHLAIPRELALVKEGTSYALIQRPPAQLQAKRSPVVQNHVRSVTVNGSLIPVPGWRSTAYEAMTTIDVGSASSVSLHIRAKGTVRELTIGWRRQIDPTSLRPLTSQTLRDSATGQLTTLVQGQLFLQRPTTVYGPGGAPPAGFAGEWREPLTLRGGKLTLHLLVDRCSVEAFAYDGRVVMSGVMFPDPENTDFHITSSGGSVVIESLDLYEITD